MEAAVCAFVNRLASPKRCEQWHPCEAPCRLSSSKEKMGLKSGDSTLVTISLEHQKVSFPAPAGQGGHGCECLGNLRDSSSSCTSFS